MAFSRYMLSPELARKLALPQPRELLGTDLYSACEQNRLSDAQELATKSSHRPSDIWTAALDAATLGGAVDIARYALEQGGEVNDQILWGVVCSPKSDPVYRLFIDSKAVSIDHDIDRCGTVVGSLACGKRPALVEFCLERGANVNGLVQTQGYISLLAAAAGYSGPDMVHLLLGRGATLSGSGALMMAAQQHNLANVRLLLSRGANINELGTITPDPRSYENLGTALHKAAKRGYVEIIDELLLAGADLAVLDAQGKTALDVAKEQALDDAILAKLSIM